MREVELGSDILPFREGVEIRCDGNDGKDKLAYGRTADDNVTRIKDKFGLMGVMPT